MCQWSATEMKPKIYCLRLAYADALDGNQLDYVEHEHNADFLLCSNTFPTDKDPSKTILLQKESPLTKHRRWTYDNFHLFHTVVTHNPFGSNQIKFTDYPITYPWWPIRVPTYTRANTTMTKRIICYFGRASVGYASREDRWDTTTLYGTRTYLSQDLLQCDQYVVYGPARFPNICMPGTIEGESARYVYRNWVGMNPKSKWSNIWPPKLHDINACGADFILTLENCIQPNLIADKLFDAAASDRVILYLGEPHIEKHVPLECFVDLRPIFDRQTRRIDAQALLDITNNMTQDKYDSYIHAARKWRSTFSSARWHEERTKLTSTLIKRLS